MDNSEMALEALKVVRLRDLLLKQETKQVKRLKKEKMLRNKYNQTSNYKKLLKSGRLDLIDKETRSNLFTPYETLKTAYYDYYKSRKQREEESEPTNKDQLVSTNTDSYNENTNNAQQQQQQQQQQLFVASSSTPPFAISPPIAQTQYPIMYPQPIPAFFLPGMLPQGYLTPNSTGQIYPQSTLLGMSQQMAQFQPLPSVPYESGSTGGGAGIYHTSVTQKPQPQNSGYLSYGPANPFGALQNDENGEEVDY